jgi:anthranilate synthase/aminodeoxychorismate synthase-like glutamine amidotransferase
MLVKTGIALICETALKHNLIFNPRGLVMILLIDNYDSFTWNLWHFLSDLGAEVKTIRNDELSVADVIGLNPDGIVISPGPATPDKAGICIPLITEAAGLIPILGVCLGHQAIGAAFGANIDRIDPPVHGKLSFVQHEGKGIFSGCDLEFAVSRYHSLVISPDSMPDDLMITAKTHHGVIMGVQHKTHPIYGVQFHPESIASENGYRILANFLSVTGLPHAISNDHITQLESQLLNLSKTHPEHIHD